MHYKNGREVKIGDHVVGRDWAGKPVGGIVVDLVPQPNTCNIAIVPSSQVTCNLNSAEFLHVDDALPKAVPVVGTGNPA